MTEREELRLLYRDGFPEDSEAYADWFFSTVRKRETYVFRENGKIVSAGYVAEKRGRLLGRERPVPYLSSLSTLTPFRGKNRISHVIDAAFCNLFDRGRAFAFLNPFHADYYRKYGFFDATNAEKTVCEGDRPYETREVSHSDACVLAALENAASAASDNAIVSDEARVKAKIEEYAADGIVGKLLLNKGRPIGFFFEESGAVTYYAAVPSEPFFEAAALAGKTIDRFCPEGRPYVQARLIDARETLRTYDFSRADDSDFRFSLSDDRIDANNFCCALSVRAGNLVDLKFSDAPSGAEIPLSAEEFGRAMLLGGVGPFPRQKNLFIDKF